MLKCDVQMVHRFLTGRQEWFPQCGNLLSGMHAQVCNRMKLPYNVGGSDLDTLSFGTEKLTDMQCAVSVPRDHEQMWLDVCIASSMLKSNTNGFP